MNKILSHALVASAALAAVQTVSATTLLTDDFTVSANQNDPNFDISSGRQTGTQATSPYTAFGSQHQVGNSTTDVGQPGGAANGNFLLLAFSSSVQNNLSFNDSLVNGKPVTISFDMYLHGDNSTHDGFDPTDWVSFTLRAAGNAGPVAGAGEFGMLVRYNGGVQLFNGGGQIAGSAALDTAGYSIADAWSFTFSDTAGTGSPFAGNGSKVTFVNGANTGSFALDQLSNTGLDLGFFAQNSVFGGIDNLSVTTVPEPTTLALAAAGLGCLALGRRQRR